MFDKSQMMMEEQNPNNSTETAILPMQYSGQFIRFGDIPKDEKSKNYLTDELENGVSVYDYIICNGKLGLIFPNLTYSSCVSLSGVLDRPCYLVSGYKIGIGSDGEPLIQNVKIIKNVTGCVGLNCS